MEMLLSLQIYSWSEQELLSKGYRILSAQSERDQKHFCVLKTTIEKIQQFFLNQLQLFAASTTERMYPFVIQFQNNKAFYRVPTQNDQHEYFTFTDEYVYSPELVAHEFTHGMIERLNPLGNQGEAGAINEAIADIVGVVFKRNMFGKNYIDWKIHAIRDLSCEFFIFRDKTTQKNYQNVIKLKPNKFPSEKNDYGYIHNNSNFLSHAFYLAATHSYITKVDPKHLTMLHIWLTAIKNLSDQEKTFKKFAEKTVEIAGNKEGVFYRDAIKFSWKKVGLNFS